MVERRYWQIGREIVEELQGGDESAGYGKKVLSDLSAKLQGRYSKGFSVTNLRYFRSSIRSTPTEHP